MTCGVRQGDPISPTLFSIYVNDLILHLTDKCPILSYGQHNFNSLVYADDMVLIAETEKELQSMLDELQSWCKKWRLKINQDKSKIIHFRKPNVRETEFDFRISGLPIDKVKTYKYLGVILDKHLKFDECIKCLAGAGGRALGATIHKFKTLKDVGFQTYTTLFNTGVKSVLHYGSAVWGGKKETQIDTIQNRAICFYLGVHKFAPTAAIQGDMGWYPLYIDRYMLQ